MKQSKKGIGGCNLIEKYSEWKKQNQFPLIIIIASQFENPPLIVIAAVLGITGWAWGARVLRADDATRMPLAAKLWLWLQVLAGLGALAWGFARYLALLASLG